MNDKKLTETSQNTLTVSELFNRDIMQYARYTITDRAISSVEDGLKPVQRKAIWAMYVDKLFNNKFRQKSVNVVGTTMRYSPHGDTGIYGAIVNMASQNYMNYNLINGKGSFGTVTSSGIQPASMRYTEIKLNSFSEELYRDINELSTNMVLNYNETLYEPEVLPSTIPLILLNYSTGMGLGIASEICPFNMEDVFANVVRILDGKDTVPMYPDFLTKGSVYATQEDLESVKTTGRGKFTLRGKCHYDDKNNKIIINEIPYNTTFEAIVDKVKTRYNKNGDFQDIKDIEINTGKGFNGISIDLKRGADVDYVIAELFSKTSLENNINANFYVLYKQKPYLWGTDTILKKWIEFRKETIKNTVQFNLNQVNHKLMLLNGLMAVGTVITDVVREITQLKNKTEVIKYLEHRFKLNSEQSEYISDMRITNLNEEYFHKKIQEIETLEKEKLQLESTLKSDKKISNIIKKDLIRVYKEHSKPRQTEIIDIETINEIKKEFKEIKKEGEKDMTNYAIITTKENYVKRMLATSMRAVENIKVKDGDKVLDDFRISGDGSLMTFTNLGLAHKTPLSNVKISKPSELGDYAPRIHGTRMGYEELPLYSIVLQDDWTDKDVENSALFIGFNDGSYKLFAVKSLLTTSKNVTLKNIWDNEIFWYDKRVEPVLFKYIPNIYDEDICFQATLHTKGEPDRTVIRPLNSLNVKATRTSGTNIFIDRKFNTDWVISFDCVNKGDIEEKYLASNITLKRKGVAIK